MKSPNRKSSNKKSSNKKSSNKKSSNKKSSNKKSNKNANFQVEKSNKIPQIDYEKFPSQELNDMLPPASCPMPLTKVPRYKRDSIIQETSPTSIPPKER